jgi:hypothetical protein
MIEDLAWNFKITPRKSLTLEPPDLPLSLARHFIRGVVDGDGSVYRDRLQRLNLSVRGTANILRWIKEMADQVCPRPRPANVRWHAGYPDYGIHGTPAEKFYLWLHRDCSTYLDRKCVYLSELLAKEDSPSIQNEN